MPRGDSPELQCRCRGWQAHCLRYKERSSCTQDGLRRVQQLLLMKLFHPGARGQPKR